MMKKNIRLVLFAVLLLFILIAINARSNTSNIQAQTSIISGSSALDLALASSADDGFFGGALIPPTKVYGQIMTYEEAILFVSGKPIEPNTRVHEIRGVKVWLVILEGEFVSHVPSSADGIIPAKDIIHSQMAIILNGNTGEILRRTLVSPQRKLSVVDFIDLQDSGEAPSILPTKGPIITEAPLYQTITP